MDSAGQFSLAFLESQPLGAARVLNAVDSDEAAAYLADAPIPAIARALGHMQPVKAAEILRRLEPKRTAGLLLQMPASARSVLLRALPESAIDGVLSSVSARERAAIRRYLAYPPGTVGAWMDAPKLTFAPDSTVARAIEQVRLLGERPGSSVLVIETDRRLAGSVALDLLLSEPDSVTLHDIMQRDIAHLSPQAPLTSVISLAAWDSSLTLPVVDRGRHLVGVLSFDSVREGLVADRASTDALPINQVVVQIAQAYLVCLSGLFHVTTAPGEPARLGD